MASKFLKATGNWSDNNTWSDTDGGAAGVAYPRAGDNVFLTANGNGLTLTLDIDPACDSFVASGACTATLAGTKTVTVGGNVTLLSTMTIPNTITWTVTGTGNFAGSTLATLGTINLNGTAHTVSGAFTCVTLTRNGTATKTDTLTLTSGTTLTCTTFAIIGNSATNRLLVQSSTLGTAANVKATNWTGSQNIDIMDITAINKVDLSAITGLSGDCGGNGCGDAILNGEMEVGNPPTSWNVWGAPTRSRSTDQVHSGTYSLKLINAGVTCAAYQTPSNKAAMNGKTVVFSAWVYATDASRVRLWIQDDGAGGVSSYHSGTPGWELLTATCVISCTGTTLNFHLNINSASATTAYFDDVTALFTEGLGSSTNFALTAAAVQTYAAGGTNIWSESGRWTSSVPLPQDDVICAATVTIDMPRIGKSVTFMGSPTVSLSNNISVYGSLTLAGTWTHANKSTSFCGRGNYTATLGNKTMNDIGVRAPTGTYTFVSGVTIGTSFTATAGTVTFTDGVTFNFYTVAISGDITRVVNLGSATINLGGGDTNTWVVGGTNVTVNAGTSTIINTNGGVGAQTFTGGSKTYNNVTIVGAGAYALTIRGSNTFNTVTVDASQAAKTIKFTDGTTQTVNNFLRDYGGTNIITLTGTSTAGWALALAGGGVVYLDYLAISYSTVTPANLWFAGVHSANSAGAATGWLFRSHRNKNQNNTCGISSDWMYV